MTSSRPHLLLRPESVSRALGFYIPATAVARALGLARGVILARLISEHEFGLFQVTLLVVNVLNPLCGLGLNEGIARYVPMYETRGVLRSYLRRAVPFVGGIALLLSAVIFAAAAPLGRAIYATLPEAGQVAVTPEAWTTLTRIAASVTFGTVVYFLVLAILKGMRMFRAVSALELLNNLLFTATTIAVAVAGWETASAMMACYGATLVFVIVVFALPMSRTIADEPARRAESAAPSPRERAISQLIKFSSWAAVAAIVWQLLQYYPMWFLQKTHGPSVTAVFGGVRLITQIVVVGAVTIIAVVQTAVTKLWESKGHDEADRLLLLAYKSTSLLMLVGCVAFALLAGPLMRLFPPSFAIGVPIVPISLMFFLVSSHLTFLAIHFALIERMRHLFLPWTLGLVCNVLFGVWLVSPYSPPERALMGAAWAGSLGISAALFAAIALMRHERRPIDAGTIVFWLGIYILALPAVIEATIVLGLLVIVAATNWIFTLDEKRQLRAYLRNGYSQIITRFSHSSDGTGGQS